MASNKDKNAEKANKKVQDIISTVRDNMDSLYTTTYFSTPKSNNDIKSLSQSVNDNIDKIISRNMDTIGMPSVSVLYSRIFDQAGKDTRGSLSSMFDNNIMMDDLYATFMSNRFIRELDEEIDAVCRYMPNLEEALNAKKDSVLSADHFSKDFLNIEFPTNIDNEQFSARVKELKDKYGLLELVEHIYEDTAKYGEKFVYCVPYSTALTHLLANKQNTNFGNINYSSYREDTITESQLMDAISSSNERYRLTMTSKSCIITGDGSTINMDAPTILRESTEYDPNSGGRQTIMKPVAILPNGTSFNINIEINNSGIIDSAIMESFHKNKIKKSRPTSMRESFMITHEATRTLKEAAPEAKGNLNKDAKKKFLSPLNQPVTQDGLISDKRDTDLSKYKVSVPGAVIKELKRDYVIPIYIEDSCMGYYYMEVRSANNSEDIMGFRNLLTEPITSMSTDGKSDYGGLDLERQDETIKYVAGQLSKFIDKKFINNNQDLAREIYQILKYNDLYNSPSLDLIKVTFVPPEDIHHFYFNQDSMTHRGVSDLARGMVPAKLYATLYITNAIGIMTRGQDKRVYRVKQLVDTNISQQLMNVVNQIKMGNFGIRQFSSINNILNITGMFNDYIMPTNASGDPPIDIDVIQGQQYDIHTDLMDILEDMAISSIEVPLEIVQSRKSVDYASRLSMSSSKFLRTVYKRQEKCENIFGPFITAIYNYEYDEDTDLDISFPPPVFLDMANTNQLITNTKDFVDSNIDIEMGNEQDEALKSRYRLKLFRHYIGTHIDTSKHAEILQQARVELAKEKKESEASQAAQPEEDNNW